MTEEQKQNNEFNEDENFFSSSENVDDTQVDDEKIELPYTLELELPFIFNGKEYNELVFKHPLKMAFLRHIPMNFDLQKMGHYMKPISGMTGLSEAVINEMAKVDYDRCMEVIKNFT